MKSTTLSPSSFEDETSDTLSTANSYSHMLTESASFYQQLSETPDSNLISPQSKTIRKKRSAYGKIDDDKRLKLLEAVQNGETLKSASKRLGINYSSAKSIIHTYRKEGRILKKSICAFPAIPFQLTSFENTLPARNQHTQSAGTFTPFEFYPPARFSNASPTSPSYGLTGTLGHLPLENQYSYEEPAARNVQPPNIESFVQLPLKNVSMQQHVDPVSPKIPIIQSEEPVVHPWGLLKNLDDFYMNYSNSPLSGGKGNMYHEFTDSSSHKRTSNEFESFSELVNSFQNASRAEDPAFKLARFGMNQESKLMEESFSLNNNMTRENYRSLLESQCLLTDSLQKASYLNSLARFQNVAVSPINGWNK